MTVWTGFIIGFMIGSCYTVIALVWAAQHGWLDEKRPE